MTQHPRRSPLLVASSVFGLLAVALAGLYWWDVQTNPSPLVVYCAHDEVYSAEILDEFTRQTGIAVLPQFDTESTKALGLIERLLRERENPQCDVFWNNQLLGTLHLQEAGLLHPYKGDGYERIPAKFRDPDGYWVGFAARFRVTIVNRDAEAPAVGDFTAPVDRVAIAKPLFGTTLSHFALLWDQQGGEAIQDWHRDCVDRGLRVVNGNSTVKDLVANGQCDWGWTDTDDFYTAVDAGKPVDMEPIRIGDKTICLPNTVAIIRGTQRETDAQRLVDFLLSRRTELALARSRSRQVPLGKATPDDLPQDVLKLRRLVPDAIPLTGLAKSRQECLAWLKTEYLQ